MKFNFVKSDTFQEVLDLAKKAFIFTAFSTLFISTYVFAAISWPSTSPDGTSISGLFTDYFDKILVSTGSTTTGVVREAASVTDGAVISSSIRDGEIALVDLSDEVLNSMGGASASTISSIILETWTIIGNTCAGLSCMAYCVDSVNEVVGMKWLATSENYNECINNEGGVSIKVTSFIN